MLTFALLVILNSIEYIGLVKPGNRLVYPVIMSLGLYLLLYWLSHCVSKDVFMYSVYGVCLYNIFIYFLMGRAGSIRHIRFFVPGLIYIGWTIGSIHYFQYQPNDYWQDIILLLCLTWASDIGSFFIGRRFGKRPLAPRTSPNKTVEGFLGGLISSMLFACIAAISGFTPWTFILVAIVVHTTSVMGDLMESKLKRLSGVKDSSQLIPGHGGFLDRSDGLIYALPFGILLFDWLIK